jgi:hypothetical protein
LGKNLSAFCSANLEKSFGDLEKLFGASFGDFGEIVFGDLEKSCSAIWRNVVGAVTVSTYWSSS